MRLSLEWHLEEKGSHNGRRSTDELMNQCFRGTGNWLGIYTEQRDDLGSILQQDTQVLLSYFECGLKHGGENDEEFISMYQLRPGDSLMDM